MCRGGFSSSYYHGSNIYVLILLKFLLNHVNKVSSWTYCDLCVFFVLIIHEWEIVGRGVTRTFVMGGGPQMPTNKDDIADRIFENLRLYKYTM